MVYVCKNCGCVTDDPNVDTDYEYFGGRCYTESWLGECHCGGELEEAKECPECGEYHAREYDVCDECLEEKMTFDNIRKYSDDRFSDSEVKVPCYIAEILGDEIIVDVLYNELKRHFDGYEEETKKFITEDVEDFLEWMKKKEEKRIA